MDWLRFHPYIQTFVYKLSLYQLRKQNYYSNIPLNCYQQIKSLLRHNNYKAYQENIANQLSNTKNYSSRLQANLFENKVAFMENQTFYNNKLRNECNQVVIKISNYYLSSATCTLVTYLNATVFLINFLLIEFDF